MEKLTPFTEFSDSKNQVARFLEFALFCPTFSNQWAHRLLADSNLLDKFALLYYLSITLEQSA